MKLLIVDDNAAMHRLICSVVADLAETIIECADGTEAIEAYAAAQFSHADWVLMDVQMQKLDGLLATRALKARWPEARVIIVTDYDDARLRAEAAQAEACAYVLKEDLLTLRLRLASAR